MCYVSWINQNDSICIVGDPFGDGEEMYLQGAAIWHPRCGPGPTEASQIIFNNTSGEIDRMSNSAMSEIHVSSFLFRLLSTTFSSDLSYLLFICSFLHLIISF